MTNVPHPRPPSLTAVTEQQIVNALDSVLRDNTVSFTSLNAVVQHLESKLGFSLAHYVDFIRRVIQNFLLAQQKDRYAPHQAPNFQPMPPQQQLQGPNLNFAPQQVYYGNEGYVFSAQTAARAPPQPPVPVVVVKNPNVAAPAKAKSPTVKRRRGGPGGLNKLCGVTPELQTIVGQPTMPRTEIVKQLWAYIRKHNLQDPNNKRKIICNDELRLVFETDSTDMFKMNKLLAKHIITLDPSKETIQSQPPDAKKPRVDDVESSSKSEDDIPIVIISEALAYFLGTDEREMSQAEVLRQMWEYVKINQLEDPTDPAAIKCDAKLQELLGCESISALGLPETLTQRHLDKKP